MNTNNLLAKLKRKLSNTSANSTGSDSSLKSLDATVLTLTTEPDSKRDFCEFLNGVGLPDLIKYVDFIDACHQLNYMDDKQLRDSINYIYNRHIRKYAPDKIFFELALVFEIETKLTKEDFTSEFYLKATQHCIQKIEKPFNLFVESQDWY